MVPDALDSDRGYRRGFAAGWDVGRGYADFALNQDFAGRDAAAPKVTPGATHAELQRRRDVLPEDRDPQPCPCLRCCWVARLGGDHIGGPVEWESSR